MVWMFMLVVVFGLVAIFVHRSRFRPVLRLTIGSAAFVYFVIAAATTSARRAPFVFFALLALGVVINELRRRKQEAQVRES